MAGIIDGLLQTPVWLLLALLFVLPALEAPAFLGLVLPGEIVLVLAGVLVHQGRIPLVPAALVAIAGTIAGDTAGYWVGRRYGQRLLRGPLGRLARPARLRRAEELLRHRGALPTLLLGRLTGGIRVVVPGLAGTLRVRPGRFLPWNALAATVWAVLHLGLGYLAGEGWQRAHQFSSRAGLVAAGVLVLAVTATLLLRRRRRRQRPPTDPDRQVPTCVGSPHDH